MGNFIWRLVFFLYYFSHQSLPALTVAKSFAMGMRFDIATIFLFNGWLFLLLSLPMALLFKGKRYLIHNVLLFLLNLFVFFVNGMDVIYFGFSSKRLTFELTGLGKDAGSFGIGDFLPYWWLFLILILMQWLLLRFWNRSAAKCANSFHSSRKWWSHWLLPIPLVFLLILGIRGGLQTRPLKPSDAFITSNIFQGNLSLNSGYTILSSLNIGGLDLVELVDQQQAVRLMQHQIHNDFDSDFISPEFPFVRKTKFSSPETRYNVVVLILESFNAKRIGTLTGKTLAQSNTPNFDRLAQKGWLFTRGFANGARSIQSIPAILNSSPDIIPRPLIGSAYETNWTWGLGNILESKGYQTDFICGGPNGTMGFDSYSKISGFQSYYGRDDFPGESVGNSSKWGLSDAVVLDWMADIQSKAKEPFLTTWFSISNHYPFELPEECPETIKNRGGRSMEKTMMYTDWTLGNYFDKVQNEPWFGNTIFVFCADHCFFEKDESDRTLLESFEIPLLIVGPGIKAKRDNQVASQIDILPTLIDLMKLDTYHASMGNSLCDSTQSSIAINEMMGLISIVTDTVSWASNFKDPQASYLFIEEQWKRYYNNPRAEELEALLQSYYQCINNLRVENNLIERRWMK